jgi:hypothetical protein
MWPSVSLILQKIHYYLPRVPRVTVQLFRDSHPNIQVEEREQAGEF